MQYWFFRYFWEIYTRRPNTCAPLLFHFVWLIRRSFYLWEFIIIFCLNVSVTLEPSSKKTHSVEWRRYSSGTCPDSIRSQGGWRNRTIRSLEKCFDATGSIQELEAELSTLRSRSLALILTGCTVVKWSIIIETVL